MAKKTATEKNKPVKNKPVKKKQAVVPHNKKLPAVMSFEDDAGGGMENVDQDSVAIPYIKLLQSNSPEVDEEEEAYIPGAKVGRFIHTISEVIEESLTIVPCFFERVFNEWADRETGGGFKGRFSIPEFKALDTQRDDAGKYWRPDGETYFADTRNHYVLLVGEDGSIEPVIISLTSTQIKVSKKWMSVQKAIRMKSADGKSTFVPPCYAHKFQVTSTSEQNAKGKFKGWNFSMLGVLNEKEAHIYTAAKEFARLVEEGERKAADPGVVDDVDDSPDM